MHFAADNYESIIEINFVRDEKYKGIITDGYDVASIIKNISLIDPSKKFLPGKTLIFFDEITEFPEIATALKFFCIDGRFDVICSGSMLGVNHRKIESNSVGYKKDYEMFSMDFEEFLWAKGYGEDTVKSMLSHMAELKPFSSLEMEVFHGLFLDYNVLGGMPAVVRDYIGRCTFEASLAIVWSFLNCPLVGISMRIPSSCILRIQGFWCPCWTRNPKRTFVQTKISAFIRRLVREISQAVFSTLKSRRKIKMRGLG